MRYGSALFAGIACSGLWDIDLLAHPYNNAKEQTAINGIIFFKNLSFYNNYFEHTLINRC